MSTETKHDYTIHPDGGLFLVARRDPDGVESPLVSVGSQGDAAWLVDTLTERNRLYAQRDAMLAACEDSMRQLASLSDRLLAKVPPPHVSYVSKQRAGEWAAGLRDNLRAAIEAAKALAAKRQEGGAP